MDREATCFLAGLGGSLKAGGGTMSFLAGLGASLTAVGGGMCFLAGFGDAGRSLESGSVKT